MRKQHLHLIAGATIAAFAGLAVAQTSPTPSASPSMAPSTSPSAFTKLDSDKNGMVSKKEASKNKELTSKWDILDTNKDGNLDQGEFAAFEAPTSSTPKY